jgi:hypothetical protein
MNLYRYYIAYTLRNISVVNNVRITDSERLKGHRLFSIGITKNSVRAPITSNRNIQRNDRHLLYSQNYSYNIINQVSTVEKKVSSINGMWNTIVDNIVKETIVGIDRMERRKGGRNPTNDGDEKKENKKLK